MSNKAVIAFGSNKGDSKMNISLALQCLNSHAQIKVISTSSLFETKPVGFSSENDFLNGCLEIKTSLDPGALLLALQCLEKELGREKTKPGYEDREIDLDIIYFNSLAINSETLVIPHPRMRVRNFVLEPLAEICPNWIHPLYLETSIELLSKSPDKEKANRMNAL